MLKSGVQLTQEIRTMALTTITVRRMAPGPSLVIESAEALALEFFSLDPSSSGALAYDSLAGAGDPNRISRADVVAINTSMAARSRHTAWVDVVDLEGPLPWLAEIQPSWNLFTLTPDEWEQMECTSLLSTALARIVGPYRGISVGTKVLHLKRPALIPVLDSLVLQQLGASPSAPPISVLLHLREQGRANLRQLEEIATQLAGQGFTRSLVRILEALIWVTHPAASLSAHLHKWEYRFVPASPVAGGP
jgi:hypothetical protein